MMTDDQKARVSKLKAAIAAATTTDGAPHEVRTAAVELKRELKRAGTTARSFAEAVGVHVTTLCRWEHDAAAASLRPVAAHGTRRERGSSFRMVHVVEPSPKASRLAVPPMPAGGGLRVAHGPSGLVIDGLDVDTLAVLLRRMS